MVTEKSLQDQYKVCQKCNKVSAPGITECPICGEDNFRQMTEEEKNNSVPIFFFTLEYPTRRITEAKGCRIFGD